MKNVVVKVFFVTVSLSTRFLVSILVGKILRFE